METEEWNYDIPALLAFSSLKTLFLLLFLAHQATSWLELGFHAGGP